MSGTLYHADGGRVLRRDSRRVDSMSATEKVGVGGLKFPMHATQMKAGSPKSGWQGSKERTRVRVVHKKT